MDRSLVGDTPSQAVLETVANAENVDPIDLSPPLYEAIDPDALNRLFPTKDRNVGRISFPYHGYNVIIERDGQVMLESLDES